jgi:hypothetical protein
MTLLVAPGHGDLEADLRSTPGQDHPGLPASGAALYGVTAASVRSAWAVGWAYRGSKTLILHWNGTVWTRVPSPTPAGDVILSGVAATSASSAWAVGWASSNPHAKTLTVSDPSWATFGP